MINCYSSPVGYIHVECIDDVVISATLLDVSTVPKISNPKIIDFFEQYFKRQWKPDMIDFEQEGTPFEQEIWKIILAIPFGSTKTYKQIAMQIGDEKYSRAVANAVGKNKLAIIVPCHRVIGTAGDLRGFAWGVARKNGCSILNPVNKTYFKRMIVVTGALGFIGSNLVRGLNKMGITNLLLVDDFDAIQKAANLEGCEYQEKINRTVFQEWFVENAEEVEFVFHIGARTDTAEFNFRILDSLNLAYSKALWEICVRKDIPFFYASSAATYGVGEQGFDDNEQKIALLKPLNPYGLSKQLFDMFVLEQTTKPTHWMGFKFFNVYGPHETHKGRMASVIFHAYYQIKESASLKLFQSHHPDFKDGEQLRDFVYVEDVVAILLHFYTEINAKTATSNQNGIFNLGTGRARSFNDLGRAVFMAMNKPVAISYIPIPIDIRDKYQYFTEANMAKSKRAGFTKEFTALEDGVQAYVHFLQQNTSPKL